MPEIGDQFISMKSDICVGGIYHTKIVYIYNRYHFFTIQNIWKIHSEKGTTEIPDSQYYPSANNWGLGGTNIKNPKKFENAERQTRLLLQMGHPGEYFLALAENVKNLSYRPPWKSHGDHWLKHSRHANNTVRKKRTFLCEFRK